MQTTNEQLTDWIISRIKNKFKNEISLLIGEETYKLDTDRGQAAMSFFFPTAEKASGLTRTFIIDSIGYDLFPLSWERMESIANLEEDNAPVLLDARILYSKNEAEKNHFLELQARLKNNLSNTEYTYRKALSKLAVAMELYQNILFEDSLYKVRKAAGFIVVFLSNAVAYTNQTYFKHGHISFMAELSSMKNIPQDFITLIENIVKAGSREELNQQCYELVHNTRKYLNEKKITQEAQRLNGNFKDLASWYHELSYHWREIYHYCKAGDAIKAYIRGCYLQSELDIVGEEFGLGELDMLGAYNANDLMSYRQRAEIIEKRIRSIIIEHGAVIDEYKSISDFLIKNG